MTRPSEPERDAARARGDKRYFSARACPHGHIGERFVISTACCKCGDIRRAERLGKPKTEQPRRQSPEMSALNIEAGQARFNLPSFADALSEYHHSAEGRARSRYLDSLLTKVPNNASNQTK